MNTSRIILINSLIFVVIITLSAMTIMQDRELPGEPEFLLPGSPGFDDVEVVVKEIVENQEAEEQQMGGDYPSLGKKKLFDPLVPQPTPSPTPPPTPVPPPDINSVTEHWKLSFVGKTFASFNNIKTNEDWNMKKGESYTVTYRGQNVPVYLEELNRKQWSVTIAVKEGGKVQTKTIKMF